jgi:putative spermidine/putrescine transport system substrate-binding protein
VQHRGTRRGRVQVTSLVAALVVSACGGAAVETSAIADPGDGTDLAGTPDPGDWDAVLAAARGSTLDLHMWGGSTEINRFVDEVYGPPLAELGITLNRVPLADTADAVNAVLGQLEAGRTEGGSVDLIWINGENFATMRQADALLEGWAEQLPNAALVDWDDPSIAFDAGLPVDGAESPWGSAQFQFVYDSARTEASDLPRTYAELADWIVANPGRFTYPAPPAFHGTRFVKQWFYELSGGAEPWLGEVDGDDIEAAAAELWRLLDELRPHLWRGGGTYPADIAELDRLFANGEVDLTFTQLPAGIGANIDAGVLPPTARPYVFDTGTIGDHHYLAIPRNAADAAAAMVLADLVLGPEVQAAKLDPAQGWGDGLAVSVDRLDPEQVAVIDALVAELGSTAVDQSHLEAARLPDTRGEVTSALERGWDRHVRQRQPLEP